VAKATGNTAGIPTIAFDLAAMESSLVGASTDRLRTALKIIDAVSQGRMLFIATCNSIASLPPELRRRFTLGTFFFDLPTEEEREIIWQIYLRKYDVSGELPDDEGWTGAEIKECCRKAHRLGMSLPHASRYIVPVSRSAAEQVKALRQMASVSLLLHARGHLRLHNQRTHHIVLFVFEDVAVPYVLIAFDPVRILDPWTDRNVERNPGNVELHDHRCNLPRVHPNGFFPSGFVEVGRAMLSDCSKVWSGCVKGCSPEDLHVDEVEVHRVSVPREIEDVPNFSGPLVHNFSRRIHVIPSPSRVPLVVKPVLCGGTQPLD
jgi:hypothetical protein